MYLLTKWHWMLLNIVVSLFYIRIYLFHLLVCPLKLNVYVYLSLFIFLSLFSAFRLFLSSCKLFCVQHWEQVKTRVIFLACVHILGQWSWFYSGQHLTGNYSHFFQNETIYLWAAFKDLHLQCRSQWASGWEPQTGNQALRDKLTHCCCCFFCGIWKIIIA